MSIFKKKIAAVLSAVAVAVTSLAVTSWADTTVSTAQKDSASGLWFEVDGSNAKIVWNNERDRTGTITVPATVTASDGQSLPVTYFDWRIIIFNKVTGISIPDSVTKIDHLYGRGQGDFLATIEVGSGNTEYCAINNVLYNKDKTQLLKAAPALTSVTIEPTVKIIGVGAFMYSLVHTITIPEGVEEIGNYAFDHCGILAAINIPASVVRMGNSLAPCSNVQEITVAAGNTAYKAVDNVLFTKDGTTLIQYPMRSNVKEYVIPDGVTKIGSLAFEWTPPATPSLTKITFPVSLTSTHMAVLDAFGAETAEGGAYKGAAIEYKGTKEQWNNIKFSTEDSNMPVGIDAFHNIKCTDGTIYGFTAYEVKLSTNDKDKVSQGIKVEAPNGAFDQEVKMKKENPVLTDTRFDIDISFVNASGEEVQPVAGKSVTVKIPVPDAMQSASKIYVYHTDKDGNMSEVTAEIVNENSKKYVVFTASSFSVYTISSQAISSPNNNNNNSNNNQSGFVVITPTDTSAASSAETAAPETTTQASAAETTAATSANGTSSEDKNQATGAAIAILPAILAAAAVAASKKRK